MRILGIDPGIAIVGWGIIDHKLGKFTPIAYGAIRTEANTPTEDRLSDIFSSLEAIIEKYKPDAFAIEELFWNTNQKTGIIVAEARGVILLAAKRAGLTINEYTPLQVKQAVVGYGRAEKNQVITMVTMLLGLKKPPSPDDTADALAVAVCHAHTGDSRLREFYNKPTTMKGKIT
ncbi:MAG: crossover junction endodeoxyribonuclease RuvC [Clostridia bacterium]|nr:crossover junction endodeoxyribonuclease RuvC [Clostridia bacterium]